MSTTERTPRKPARKRTPSKSTSARASAANVSVQRKQEVLGIVLMALAVLLTLAVVSHTQRDDATVGTTDWRALFEFGDNRLDNLLGVVGAFAARLFVTDLVGFPVVALFAVLLAWGWVMLRQKTPLFLPLLTGLTVAGALFAACFFGWLDTHTDADLMRWSGGVGVGVAGWLSNVLGDVGALIVLVVGLVVTVLLAVDRDIQTSLDRVEGAAVGLHTGLTDGWDAYRAGATERKLLRGEARASAFAERAERSKARDAQRAGARDAAKAAAEARAKERGAAQPETAPRT
ncbi:MAG TPA: DNA translocase FtsK 4TM domain-containing protein, partial [Rubricoccaceae bacterium]